jgi:CMP-N-acetylneuraminic acid synthetase
LSNDCNILAIVPVRKDILGLALRPFHQSNLLDITVKKLLESKRIKDVIISSNEQAIEDFCSEENYNFHRRNETLSALNSPIESTINNILDSCALSESIEYLSIVNYEYPFMDIRNVENSIDILNIYNAFSSMSIIASESNYFNHDGTGLVPLMRNKSLRLEREKLYEETGGIHSVNLAWFKENKKLHSEKVSHLIIDRKASRKVTDLDDLKMLELIFANP